MTVRNIDTLAGIFLLGGSGAPIDEPCKALRVCQHLYHVYIEMYRRRDRFVLWRINTDNRSRHEK